MKNPQWCNHHWERVRPLIAIGTHSGLTVTMALMQSWIEKRSLDGTLPASGNADEINTLLASQSPICCSMGEEALNEAIARGAVPPAPSEQEFAARGGMAFVRPSDPVPPLADASRVVLPDQDWLCAEHGRRYQRAGITKAALAQVAMFDVLMQNDRFVRRLGPNPDISAINIGLRDTVPWCCFLSSPERELAFDLAQNPKKLAALQQARKEENDARA